MKTVFKIAILLFLPFVVKAQQSKPDSLRTVLQNAVTDSARHNACIELYFYYFEVNRDSALLYAEKRLALARQNNQKLAEAGALISKGYQYSALGRYSESFQNLLQAIKIAEDPKNEEVQGWRVAQYPIPGKGRLLIVAVAHHVLGSLMENTENPEQGIIQVKEGLRIATQINHPDRQMVANMNLANTYFKMNQLDSALYFANTAQFISRNHLAQQYLGNNFINLGNIYRAKGDKVQALQHYYQGLLSATIQNNQNDVAKINHQLVDFYLRENKKDSALNYAVKNLQVVESLGGIVDPRTNMGTAYEDLYHAYKLNNQHDSTYKYQSLAFVVKDSLYKIRIRNLADFQKQSLGEAMRLENLEKERIQTQSKIRTYGMFAGLVVLSIIGFILYRNNRQKQKANKVLEVTLTNLKSTQSQLIQSEKMASLGELTAGIAHEIQNPLNFVNNFSEVNTELIGELEQEVSKGNLAEVKAIVKNIKDNEQKINHHGKRAGEIVKGMLQHSRTSSGQKELTDINVLCDEYLRFAYHGLKAKDKSFNAKFETNLDSSLPKINVVPQDIGRVILNLINNAFYAVSERLRQAQPDSAYEPAVTVTTKRTNGNVFITVQDNGSGIPDSIKEKIFQPFFTTKPTGQGTGLGLSLSYDIIKVHGGALQVESEVGVGTQFIIQLILESK